MSAPLAAVRYDIAAPRVRLDLDGTHDAAAPGSPVAGIYVNVERAEANGAMVARRVTERLDLCAAVCADKAAVIFSKPFFIHKSQKLPVRRFFAARIFSRRKYKLYLYIIERKRSLRNHYYTIFFRKGQ